MSLSPGTKLSHYEIVESIGKGGMGEVYKARDTRLGRVVAIKVLPPHLPGNARLRQRFEREARMISKLSHPNLCVLHDIGREKAVDFMVMEYLEGETLADRLSKRELPLAEALRYAVQIADGLDAAHGAGVVHRDLKPSNVVLIGAGAKLLDSGLAKAALDDLSDEASALPTKDKPLTEEGAIVGTIQYMSPEQLEGKDADERSDLFALGAVLYEMLTGKKAFSGTSKASLIAAIMSTDPPRISTLRPVSPPALDRIVERCLAKDPRKRWQTALDLREELDWTREGASAAARQTTQRRTVIGLILAAAAVVGFALLSPSREPDPPRPTARFRLGSSVDESAGFSTVALSPDGLQLAFVARGGLHVRSLSELEPRTLVQLTEEERSRSPAGTIVSPVFSPDGQWIAYWSPEGTLRRVSVAGGAPVTLCEARFARGLGWDLSDRILFTQDSVGVVEIASTGGTPRVLVPLGAGEYAASPQQLGEDTILFTRTSDYNDWDRAQIVLHSIPSGEQRVLVDPGMTARVLPTGHIVFVRDTTLYAARFDARRLELASEPLRAIANVRDPYPRALAVYSVSRTGSLVYVPTRPVNFESRLVWVDRSGRITPAIEGSEIYGYQPRISPDGTRLAVTAGSDIWVHDLERGTRSRLTREGSSNHRPAWSPDGSRIGFVSDRAGNQDIYWARADGAGDPERLLARAGHQLLDDWSPDGTFLTFEETAGGGFRERNIWTLPLEGDPKPVELTPSHDRMGRISPHGKWMAYVSNESGRDEIYVRELVDGGRKVTVSAGGGSDPVWAPSGAELVYRNGLKMMAVDVRHVPFSVSSPRVLFETDPDVAANPWMSTHDVTPDGMRFLMIALEL